jgi:hypothetical protein
MKELKGVYTLQGADFLGSFPFGSASTPMRTSLSVRDQASSPRLFKPFSNPCPVPLGDGHYVTFGPGFPPSPPWRGWHPLRP